MRKVNVYYGDVYAGQLGMLEMICGMDAIGKFVLKRPEE